MANDHLATNPPLQLAQPSRCCLVCCYLVGVEMRKIRGGSGPQEAPSRGSQTDCPTSGEAALLAEIHELTKALTGLTCGGSEFFDRKGDRYVADIPACVAYVRRRQLDQHDTICREIRARRHAEATLAAIQNPAREGLSEPPQKDADQ